MSSYEYPEDEFDAPQAQGREPIGVHRAPVPAWRAWVPLLVVLIVVPCLAWAAVVLLGRSGHQASDLVGATSATQAGSDAAASAAATEADQDAADAADAAASATPAADATAQATEQAQPTASPTEAAVDKSTGVTIHNGSSVNGLAGRTGQRLEDEGYTAVTVNPGQYRQSQPSVTTVYYADASREATARAIAQQLGIDTVVESAQDAASNPVVIVLRADFSE